MTAPDLADLEALALVAAARSFRGAAARSGLSASSLSDAVRRLEARLGVRLLNRTTRSVAPTEAGLRLLERLRPALAEVRAALDVVNGFRDSPTGTLRLNVPGIVGRLMLPRILPPFQAEHPGITVEVTADDQLIDVLGAGFDAGVRYGEMLEQDMIAVPLGPRVQRYALAAAPSYLERHGSPGHPRDLLGHACLRYRFLSGARPAWEFERAGQVVRVDPSGPLLANSIEMILAGAAAGLGIVFSFEDLVAPLIAEGRLVALLPDWWGEFPGPFLYCHDRRLMPAPLRAFIDHLRGPHGRW
ncbi:LysR family transcriptional regulator [Zavarzinia compransoris]|uniref:LysR family transcriptional regulator n=1 Tax=Zavarzinia compransoris TaxID=1264899 RepID=A0A317E4T3_9PROT|nr:LysR family transcriptional regulator [Zavarzinia compransoris]PWR22138.1 LysR family transcriptional regulator [Zavarzinia compransoris]TDP47111.1 LysR family transcriptional regulator [Zavarzinia compransoris]